MRPTLALIHGLGDDATAWHTSIDLLSDRYDCLALDIPGFGSRSDERAVDIDDVADELWSEIATAADGGPVVLAGHSLGGVLVTLIGERRPTPLVGIVNVEGNLTDADCYFSRQAVESGVTHEWLTTFADDQQSRGNARYAAALRRCEPTSFSAMAEALVRLSTNDDLARRFASIDAPTRYLHGTTAMASLSLEAIEHHGIHAIHVPDAGHWVMEDDPRAFVRAVDALAVDR